MENLQITKKKFTKKVFSLILTCIILFNLVPINLTKANDITPPPEPTETIEPEIIEPEETEILEPAPEPETLEPAETSELPQTETPEIEPINPEDLPPDALIITKPIDYDPYAETQETQEEPPQPIYDEEDYQMKTFTSPETDLQTNITIIQEPLYGADTKYTITATNNTDQTLYNINLETNLPPELEYIESTLGTPEYIFDPYGNFTTGTPEITPQITQQYNQNNQKYQKLQFTNIRDITPQQSLYITITAKVKLTTEIIQNDNNQNSDNPDSKIYIGDQIQGTATTTAYLNLTSPEEKLTSAVEYTKTIKQQFPF